MSSTCWPYSFLIILVAEVVATQIATSLSPIYHISHWPAQDCTWRKIVFLPQPGRQKHTWMDCIVLCNGSPPLLFWKHHQSGDDVKKRWVDSFLSSHHSEAWVAIQPPSVEPPKCPEAPGSSSHFLRGLEQWPWLFHSISRDFIFGFWFSITSPSDLHPISAAVTLRWWREPIPDSTATAPPQRQHRERDRNWVFSGGWWFAKQWKQRILTLLAGFSKWCCRLLRGFTELDNSQYPWEGCWWSGANRRPETTFSHKVREVSNQRWCHRRSSMGIVGGIGPDHRNTGSAARQRSPGPKHVWYSHNSDLTRQLQSSNLELQGRLKTWMPWVPESSGSEGLKTIS